MVKRRGAGRLGCLLSLLVAAAVAYFAVNVGEIMLRRVRFEDAMKQEARFAARKSDAAIRSRLVSLADSLGLPEAAGRVHIRRGPRAIRISSEYYEHLEVPGYVKEVVMRPRAEWSW